MRGGAHVIVDQPIELLVREAPGRRPAKRRSSTGCAYATRGSGRSELIRPREPAGVRELQADEKIVGRVGAEALAMRGHELVAQRRERPRRALVDHQLIRDWRGRRGAPRPPRRPRSTSRRSARSAASGGASDRSARRRACRPSLPSAGCRSDCRSAMPSIVERLARAVTAASARDRSRARCRGLGKMRGRTRPRS